MSRRFNLYAFLSVATWILAGAVLVIAYFAISIYTNNLWPWHEVVHESGDRTLIGTTLYFEHAARELPLDLLLGVAAGGSVLFAFPAQKRTPSVPHRFRQGILATGILIVIGTILGGTLWTGGFEMLSDNLLQLHTRPGAPLTWGAHWRYHLLSRAMLMLFSLGCAGMVVLIIKGKTGAGGKAGLSIFVMALGLFAVLTIVFTLDLEPFRNPVYLGHQVREVFTHILVTIPAAWGVCLILAGGESEVSHDKTSSIHWPVVAGITSLLIGIFLLVSGLINSAASHGQTQSVILLICPHFFEHTFTYFVVPFVAGLVYESAVTIER